VRKGDTWLGIFAGRFSVLDTYFLVSRYQDEFVEWAKRTGGEVIELHVYLAQRELASAPPEVVRDLVSREVVRAWPELEGAIVHVEHFVNERTFDKQGVGYAQHQPRMRTSVPNLLLCGSWIKVDAAVHDMEKAVTTGIQAANAVLAQSRKAAWPVLSLRPKSSAQRLFARVARRVLPMPPAVRRAG
jgi:isorenieratene synthase